MIPLKRHHTFWKVLRAALIAAGLGGAACHTPAPNHPAVASPPLANHKATTEEREALDAALLMRRGIRLYHLKHLEEARLCFRTLRLQYPAFKDARTAAYTEICILQDLKVSTGLLELCQAFLAAYPDSKNADAVASLAGECLVEQAKWSEVANYYAKLETRFPKSPNLDRFTFYQGLAHFLAGEFALSTPFLESVIRDHPKSLLYEPALYHLAMTHFLNNEFQKTVATCNSYLAKFPDGPYAGDLQYRLSYIDSNDSGVKANKIISDLETFINAHPHDVCNGSMLCLLADTYKKAHEDDKALAAYQSALWSKSPDDVTQYALDCATTILQDKKDWNAIFEMLAEFLRKNPRSKLDLRVIGQGVNVNVRQGKPEQAVQTLTDALRPRVGNPAAEQVEYLLDLLVQTLVPRKRPAKEELAAVAEHLDQQLVETLTKVIGVTPNPTATARMLYARARLSQLLYRASRTERSDRLLKDLATDYADNPAALSPTLLSICGDILLEDSPLGGLRARLRLLVRLRQRHRRGQLLCQAQRMRLLTRLRIMLRALCRRLLRPQRKVGGLRGRRYRRRWTLRQRRSTALGPHAPSSPLQSGHHRRRRCQPCGVPRCPLFGVCLGSWNRRARGFLRLCQRHGLWLPLRALQRLLTRQSRLLRRQARLHRLRGLLGRLDLLLRRMRRRESR